MTYKNGVKQKGFTLVELLVVISIIALLLAILMPTLQKVRGQGQKVVCLSNLKQLGLAVQLYNEDWSGRFPPFYYIPPRWDARLLPYVNKQKGVFRCPAERGGVMNGTWTKIHSIRSESTYGINEYLTGMPGNSPAKPNGPDFSTLAYARLTQVKAPASVVTLFDMYCDSYRKIGYMYGMVSFHDWYMDKRHARGDNFLFVDGHASWLKTSELPAISIYIYVPTWNGMTFLPDGRER